MEADVAKIKQAMLGNWESIAPEIRPSKNPDGSLKPFYLKRAFKYLPSDRFELDVVNSADPNGAVPLARIKIGGHMLWQGPHPIAPGAQKVDFVADEAYEVTPLVQGFADVLNKVASAGTRPGRSTRPRAYSERPSLRSVSRKGRISWSTTSSTSEATCCSGAPATSMAAALTPSRTVPPTCRSRWSGSNRGPQSNQLSNGRQMQLAKNVIDIGLSTNNLEPMLRFWQQDAAVRFDHVLPVRRGQKQYRHDAQGSVIKLNHHAEPLPAAAPSGYRELMIAREGCEKPRAMVDPDGNRVRLVPPGHDGITQIAVAMGVRSLGEHRRFYGDILGFAEQAWSGGPAFRLGDSLLLLEEDRAATVDPVRRRPAGATSPCRSPISTPCMTICEARACARVLRR